MTESTMVWYGTDVFGDAVYAVRGKDGSVILRGARAADGGDGVEAAVNVLILTAESVQSFARWCIEWGGQ